MAYGLVIFSSFYDAESNDEVCEENLGSIVTVQNTAGRRQTGNYGYVHTYYITGSQAIGPPTQGVITDTNIFVFSFAAGVDVAPNTETKLLVRKVSSTVYGHVKIGTDRLLRFYDKNDRQVGPASMTAIPTTGMQEVVIVFDGKTLSTVYIKVYFGDTEELAFDTGVTPANFWNDSNGQFFLGDSNNVGNKGFVLYSDDFIMRSSATANDAPHITAYPRLRGVGQMMTPPDSNATGDD